MRRGGAAGVTRPRLAARLLLSHAFVVVVAVATVFVAGEAIAPLFLEAHQRDMVAMMRGPGHMLADEAMLDDLATAYRSALTQTLVWAALLATVVAVVVGSYVTQRLVAPLRALQAASRGIAGGRYAERLDERAPGEIGELAVTFNAMAASLAAAEGRREQVVTDLAHELRTPLSNLKGYVEAIEDGVLAPDADTTGAIARQVDRLEHLIADLDLLAKLDAGDARVQFERLQLQPLLRASAGAFKARFDEAGVRLSLSLPASGVAVRADPERLAQVLDNLLGNALRFTPAGGRVELAACALGSTVRVEVRDSGSGVPPELREAVFERFVRADPSRSRAEGGGSGVGLAIAKAFVERHGGVIGMQPNEGGGSVFWFTLPLLGDAHAPLDGPGTPPTDAGGAAG